MNSVGEFDELEFPEWWEEFLSRTHSWTDGGLAHLCWRIEDFPEQKKIAFLDELTTWAIARGDGWGLAASALVREASIAGRRRIFLHLKSLTNSAAGEARPLCHRS